MSGDEQHGMVTRFLVRGSCCQVRDNFSCQLRALPAQRAVWRQTGSICTLGLHKRGFTCVAVGDAGPDGSGLTCEHRSVAQTSLLSTAGSSRGLGRGHGQHSGRFGRCCRKQQPGKASGLQRRILLRSARGALGQCSRRLLQLAYHQMHCCSACRARSWPTDSLVRVRAGRSVRRISSGERDLPSDQVPSSK